MTAAPVERAARVRAGRHGGVPWPTARALAAQAAPLPTVEVALGDAIGQVLARDLAARGDLPAADISAMDGWAVAGPPPWRVVAEVAAGRVYRGALSSGQCVDIATGAAVPDGADAVLPVEDSLREADVVRPAASLDGDRPRHIRCRGEEARRGDLLLPAGTVVSPPVAGLAAATGSDTLAVVRRAVVDVLVLGDELLDEGVAEHGRARDALGPQLPAWLAALHATVPSVRRLPDDLDDVVSAMGASRADLVLTTGGTGPGGGDHLHAALSRLGARVVVDGVAVKPGHPMLLAALPDGRWVVGLPGNPLAACAALLTLVQPLLQALQGRTAGPPQSVRLATASPGRPGDAHRLVPVARTGQTAVLRPSCGPAMLRGLAGATGLAVVGPTGAAADESVPYLPLPWQDAV